MYQFFRPLFLRLLARFIRAEADVTFRKYGEVWEPYAEAAETLCDEARAYIP